MKSHWNNRYAENVAAYGSKPNKFFAEQLTAKLNGLENSRSLLLPCDGEGRNAVYAAKEGWKVDSFDESKVGVEKSLVWAKEAGVKIKSEEADAFVFTPDYKYDIIALVFAHMPHERRLEFHERVISWMKPGGLLLLEGFHKEQLGLGSGGPKNLNMLYDEEMLAGDFKGLEIDHIKRVEQILDEGPYHQGRAITMQIIARKPVDYRTEY